MSLHTYVYTTTEHTTCTARKHHSTQGCNIHTRCSRKCFHLPFYQAVLCIGIFFQSSNSFIKVELHFWILIYYSWYKIWQSPIFEVTYTTYYKLTVILPKQFDIAFYFDLHLFYGNATCFAYTYTLSRFLWHTWFRMSWLYFSLVVKIRKFLVILLTRKF